VELHPFPKQPLGRKTGGGLRVVVVSVAVLTKKTDAMLSNFADSMNGVGLALQWLRREP
jgi:hypothetical protein